MVPPSGMSVSSDAFRSASASKPSYFLMARGNTSVRKIQVWFMPIETWAGTSSPLFSALYRRTMSLVTSPSPGARLAAGVSCAATASPVKIRFGVVPEGPIELAPLAVARAVADEGLPLQVLLLGLAQEHRDVGVVAGVQDYV